MEVVHIELFNRVVIVTGGANGIGRACVIILVCGGTIAVIADFDDINGKELEKNLKGKFIKTDVTNPCDVENLK